MDSQNRRNFLVHSALGTAGFLAGTTSNSAQWAVAAPPVQRTIIDTHTHFYDPTRAAGVPWPSKDDAFLYRRTLPADYEAVAVRAGVTGTVVVEASPWVEDNQWVLDLAAGDRLIVGLVGHLTPGGEDFRKHISRFVKNPLFRGIRVGGGELKNGLAHNPFIDDLGYMADNDLELDVIGGTETLSDVAKLAKATPGLRIVINHCGGVKIDGKTVDADWLKGMQAAAESQNIFCKVSAPVEGAPHPQNKAPVALEFYEPVLNALWDTFGNLRLMYGSNWPVSARFASYANVQRIVSEYFNSKGEAEAERFFWRNSQAAYKWVKPT